MALANRTGSAPIEKADFDEVMRTRLSQRIVTEMLALADALGESVQSVVYGDEDPRSVIERSLNQFMSAATAAVDSWAAEAKDAAGRVAKVPPRDALRGMALDAYTNIVRDKPVTKRNGGIPTMTTTFTKKTDALEAATAAARDLQKVRPELSLVEARAEVWRTRSDLADAYASLPEDGAGVAVGKAHDASTIAQTAGTAGRSSAPIDAGAEVIAVLDELSNKAYELIRTGQFSSLQLARAEAWRLNPDLRERYERANAS